MTEDQGRWIIQDLNSLNGTFVNHTKTFQEVLHGGEIIMLGKTTVKFIVASPLEKDFYERIFLMTSRDSLTGVLSKGFFMEIATNEFTRAILEQRPLSFCMMDIDHFKKVNDTHGHPAGDFILKIWTHLVQEKIRPIDLFGRLGGEEFGLLLPNQNMMQAGKILERILTETMSHSFNYEGVSIPVTFSAGISTLNTHVTDLQNLIKLADNKLYIAKAEGRNCVRF